MMNETAITDPTRKDHTDPVPRDAEYWLALMRLPGIGGVRCLKLVGEYQTPRAAWERSDVEWKSDGLVGSSTSTNSTRAEALAWAKDQIDKLVKSDWMMTVIGDARYPSPIAQLDNPPPYLFLRGQALEPAPTLAVVGARQTTDYGRRVTQDLVSALALAGVTIVSGFARGIDTIAHTQTLEHGGTTIAVWGCGPDIIYPPENEALVDRVIEHGLLVTEFPFGTAPEPSNFPVRNRLIAALSDGVLVTQARERSGGLLTAQHALDQGKTVYAVPAEIGRPQFVGTNTLLKQGARVVTGPEDILADFQLAVPANIGRDKATRSLPTMTDIERRVYDGLRTTPCPIDRLAVSLGLPAGECARVIVGLELKGVVSRSAGGSVARAF